MHHASADDFLRTLLATLDELPPELARRLEEVVKKEHADRSQAIRQLFEEFAGEGTGFAGE
jgi:metal-responsive CopG/Arc/MetJ family transcriptional regulator